MFVVELSGEGTAPLVSVSAVKSVAVTSLFRTTAGGIIFGYCFWVLLLKSAGLRALPSVTLVRAPSGSARQDGAGVFERKPSIHSVRAAAMCVLLLHSILLIFFEVEICGVLLSIVDSPGDTVQGVVLLNCVTPFDAKALVLTVGFCSPALAAFTSTCFTVFLGFFSLDAVVCTGLGARTIAHRAEGS